MGEWPSERERQQHFSAEYSARHPERRRITEYKWCERCHRTGYIGVALPGEAGSGELVVDEVCPECRGGRVVPPLDEIHRQVERAGGEWPTRAEVVSVVRGVK
jgi:hypothetical protein